MTGGYYLIKTELGYFSIRLNTESAPETSSYFASLFDAGAFDGSSVFRIVSATNAEMRANAPIEVVQLGSSDMSDIAEPSIAHEDTGKTGLRHCKGAISAARGEVGENYGSFFICMRDEPELDFGGARHPDGNGFAAFGMVESGFDIVQAIFAKAEDSEYLSHPIAIEEAVRG